MSYMNILHHEHCTTTVTISEPCKHTGLVELRFVREITPDVVEHDFKMMVSAEQLEYLGQFFRNQSR